MYAVPGICIPSYLMSISCSPASVGAYFTVTVPSLLSAMSGLATFPEGILTSPEDDYVFLIRTVHRRLSYMLKPKRCNILENIPVISPFWMVNGMTKSKGLSPATSSPFIPIALSVAWEAERRDKILSSNYHPIPNLALFNHKRFSVHLKYSHIWFEMLLNWTDSSSKILQ